MVFLTNHYVNCFSLSARDSHPVPASLIQWQIFCQGQWFSSNARDSHPMLVFPIQWQRFLLSASIPHPVPVIPPVPVLPTLCICFILNTLFFTQSQSSFPSTHGSRSVPVDLTQHQCISPSASVSCPAPVFHTQLLFHTQWLCFTPSASNLV